MPALDALESGGRFPFTSAPAPLAADSIRPAAAVAAAVTRSESAVHVSWRPADTWECEPGADDTPVATSRWHASV